MWFSARGASMLFKGLTRRKTSFTRLCEMIAKPTRSRLLQSHRYACHSTCFAVFSALYFGLRRGCREGRERCNLLIACICNSIYIMTLVHPSICNATFKVLTPCVEVCSYVDASSDHCHVQPLRLQHRVRHEQVQRLPSPRHSLCTACGTGLPSGLQCLGKRSAPLSANLVSFEAVEGGEGREQGM
jgi:hypothetical protein